MTRNQKFRTVAVLLLFLVTALTVSYAWLTGLQKNKAEVIVSDAELQGIALFAPGSGGNNSLPLSELVARAGESVFQSGQAIPVSFDPAATNYFGNLRFAVRYSGTSPVYIRVSVYEQWVSGDTYLPAERIQYSLPAGAANYLLTTKTGVPIPVLPEKHFALGENGEWGEWFDDYENFRYYYNTAVLPQELGAGESSDVVTLYLFDGLTEEHFNAIANRFTAGAQLQLLFVVEAVQPNRYREFWEIEALPFETTAPAETTVAP